MNILTMIAGRGTSEKACLQRVERISRETAAENRARYGLPEGDEALPPPTTRTDISTNAPEDFEDPLDPQIFHYFSGARCDAPMPLQHKTRERKSFPPKRSVILRTQSDLMPVISEAATDTLANVCTFQPDPTCADVPDDILQRTRSASAVLDHGDDTSDMEVEYTGVGYYRRPTNASQEWIEKTMRARVEVLGRSIAQQFDVYGMAGIKPPMSEHWRTESCNSYSSQGSSSSQYSEVSDEQGRITKVYKGFGASAETRKALHIRSNSVSSCSNELYSRQAIQIKPRKSFLTHPETRGNVKEGRVCEERSMLTAHNKPSKTLSMAAPGKQETAVESGEEDWEPESPDVRKTLLLHQYQSGASKYSNIKNVPADEGHEQKNTALDRPKTTVRRPPGVKGRTLSRRTISNGKVPKVTIKHPPPANNNAIHSTVENHVPDTQELDSSAKSEEERKRDRELAELKDGECIGSASTARTSVGTPTSPIVGRRDRSQTAFRTSCADLPSAIKGVGEGQPGPACP